MSKPSTPTGCGSGIAGVTVVEDAVERVEDDGEDEEEVMRDAPCAVRREKSVQIWMIFLTGSESGGASG